MYAQICSVLWVGFTTKNFPPNPQEGNYDFDWVITNLTMNNKNA
jgi:hypothetical protein